MFDADAATNFMMELSSRFSTSHLMEALGMIYPQYWLDAESKENFSCHLVAMKVHNGYSYIFQGRNLHQWP